MPAPARPLSDAQIGGVSATPPTAESDLEPADPSLSSSGEQPHRLPLSSINTGSQLDASLPSPSLSPITAAANLARNTGYTGLFGGDDDYDDTTDISTLDASQDKLDDSNSGSFNLQDGMLQLKHMQTRHKIGTPPNEARQGKPQLSTPTLMEIPTMIDAFDAMPMEMQTYFMYQMLRRCAKPTLHFVADVVNPTLKCDFLGVLPLELSQIVIRNLDAQSMCRAAQVSKRWRVVINSDEKAWKDLLDRDGYQLPDGEMERAVREGWGWQHPGTTGWERDISNVLCSRVECDLSPPRSSNSGFVAAYEEDSTSRPKRKSTSKHTTSQKRQKRRVTPTLRSYSQPPAWMRSLESAQGPNAHANAAALAVPNPSVGLSSLRSLHLYKSLYQRHHTIRKSWMMEDTQPQHLAFRAHDRHVVTCLQFDTDKILTGSDDTSINVYDTKTGASRRKLEGHEGGVWALQYDGDTLVSGSTDRSVRVWDIKTGKCLQIFQGHTSTVRCLVILKPTKIGTNAD
ncbi:SCF ubiquitin ligase complex subunit cdc4, partial [Cryomyces antarcticus]